MKKIKLLTAVCAVGVIALCGSALGASPFLTAHADNAAALRIDFTDNTLYIATGTVTAGEDGATLTASSSVPTKEKFTSFLLYADVTAESSAIEVSFGANNTLKFTAENAIETTLEKTGGVREFSYGDFKDGGIISLEVIGNTVTVGVSARVAPEEFLYQPVAVYTAENAPGEIKLAVSGGTAKASYLHVYSLAGTIEIDPDDYDENDGKYPVKPAPEGKGEGAANKGCAGNLSASLIGSAVALGIAATAAIIIGRKKHHEK